MLHRMRYFGLEAAPIVMQKQIGVSSVFPSKRIAIYPAARRDVYQSHFEEDLTTVMPSIQRVVRERLSASSIRWGMNGGLG
jgi:hypothetical protein